MLPVGKRAATIIVATIVGSSVIGSGYFGREAMAALTVTTDCWSSFLSAALLRKDSKLDLAFAKSPIPRYNMPRFR